MKFIIFSFMILWDWRDERAFESWKTMKNISAILEKPIKYLCRPAVEDGREWKKITNCWDYSRVFTVYSSRREEEEWNRGNNFHKAQQCGERKDMKTKGKGLGLRPKKKILYSIVSGKFYFIYLRVYRSCFSFSGFRLCHEVFGYSFCVLFRNKMSIVNFV